MTTFDIDQPQRRHAGSEAGLEDVLRRIAFAVVVAGMSIAAYAVFSHQPSGQPAQDAPAFSEDWHGNSARIQPLK